LECGRIVSSGGDWPHSPLLSCNEWKGVLTTPKHHGCQRPVPTKTGRAGMGGYGWALLLPCIRCNSISDPVPCGTTSTITSRQPSFAFLNCRAHQLAYDPEPAATMALSAMTLLSSHTRRSD
jgi:hypothetical protein